MRQLSVNANIKRPPTISIRQIYISPATIPGSGTCEAGNPQLQRRTRIQSDDRHRHDRHCLPEAPQEEHQQKSTSHDSQYYQSTASTNNIKQQRHQLITIPPNHSTLNIRLRQSPQQIPNVNYTYQGHSRPIRPHKDDTLRRPRKLLTAPNRAKDSNHTRHLTQNK